MVSILLKRKSCSVEAYKGAPRGEQNSFNIYHSWLLFNISELCHAVVVRVPHKSCRRKKRGSTSANLKTVSLQSNKKTSTWIRMKGNLKLSVKRTLSSNKGSVPLESRENRIKWVIKKHGIHVL